MSAYGTHDSVIQEALLQAIVEAGRGLEYGQISITVHDSRVVRVERIERVRLDRPHAAEEAQGPQKPVNERR